MEDKTKQIEKLLDCVNGMAKFIDYIDGIKRKKVFASLAEEANSLLNEILYKDGEYTQDHTEEK